jgi:uncharacterized SAM-binding protein YcdF (DUF218 family)
MVDPSPAEPDVIVVLGCRMIASGTPSGAALRRAECAVAAWRAAGPVPLIVSGGRRWDGTAEADVLRETIAGLGVPREVVARELWSLSTSENAWYTAELLRARGLTRPGLVTCDWHMRRALACFARVGVRASPLPAATPLRAIGSRWARSALERARRWIDDRGVVDWTGS